MSETFRSRDRSQEETRNRGPGDVQKECTYANYLISSVRSVEAKEVLKNTGIYCSSWCSESIHIICYDKVSRFSCHPNSGSAHFPLGTSSPFKDIELCEQKEVKTKPDPSETQADFRIAVED